MGTIRPVPVPRLLAQTLYVFERRLSKTTEKKKKTKSESSNEMGSLRLCG